MVCKFKKQFFFVNIIKMPFLPQQSQQQYNNHHYQQQQIKSINYNNQQTCVTTSSNNCSTNGSKTTIFLTDNEYLDENILQQTQSSRVSVLNSISPIISNKTSSAPIQVKFFSLFFYFNYCFFFLVF